ncbi:MAG TPA: M23 family metallopeptidase [Treponemataceae bacterium]|nr:M23 family metallopeptidase [Treponemataceae bacterium]
MHIISYLDLNTTSSAYKTEPRISFKGQRKPRPSAVYTKAIELKTSFSLDIKKILKIILFIPKVLFRSRFLLLSIAIVFCLSLSFTNILGKKPLHIRNAVLKKSTAGEIASLDSAMIDFALPKKESFDSEGYLGTKNISQSIFTKPVRYQTYTVKAGDTISGIAKRFNLSNISTLIAINDIKNVRSLRSGQKIRIPSVDGLTHIVKSGESLSGIADKYKTSLVTLLDVNDLTTELVKKGDVLFIPGATMDATALSEALGELFKDPLGVSWRMSSPYGYRPDPFTGVRSFHTGIDMVAPLGTSIKASMTGKVAAAGYNQVYGNYVIVSHSGGYQTLYAHMTTILVKLGQNVNQGSVLGKLGSTGYSTGPHLHFSVYKNGQLINPLSVLK